MVIGSAAEARTFGSVRSDPCLGCTRSLEPRRRREPLGSEISAARNGTFVGDVLVTGARLPHSGRVRVGGAVLTVLPEPEDAPIDLWPEDQLGGASSAAAPRDACRGELYATIVRVGASEASVLVQGQGGAGRKWIARAIHDCSHHASKPFVVVDCAALPDNLLEAELFGHTRGAFTGAAEARVGSFEAAEGGTVFLDEIGELPLSMQPKLLRVLEWSQTVHRYIRDPSAASERSLPRGGRPT